MLESEAKRNPSMKIFVTVREDLTKSEHEGSASVSGAINLLSTLQCQHIVARNLAEVKTEFENKFLIEN